MRIVGGKHRGRRIEAPAGRDVRPTSDRTREALFNMIEHGGYGVGGGSVLVGATVLDAFCGTGALAFEALSRGAISATLLDVDQVALAAARATAAKLGELEATTCIARDATSPGPPPRRHALVFLDPPYAAGIASTALQALWGDGWIEPGALVAVEVAARGPVFTVPTGFEMLRERRYGAARVFLLRQTG